VKTPYKKALKDLGYDATLQLQQCNNPTKGGSRKHKIIWFSPPFNKNITIKIGNCFLQLIPALSKPSRSLIGTQLSCTKIILINKCV